MCEILLPILLKSDRLLGTNDLGKVTECYDAVLGPLGENMVMYGANEPEFLVTRPADGQPATHANGGTVGFAAQNRDAVHKFHEAGLANGGSNEGKPGPRNFTPTAYAAYLRDPDGNKICTYCFAEE